MSDTGLEERSTTLRLALKANAGFSGMSGLVLMAAAEPAGEVIGVARLVLFAVGLMLCLFAVSLWRTATRPQVDAAEARAAVWADVAWVVGSILLVALHLLTAIGNALVGLVAVIVLAFAAWQHLGLRRLQSRSTDEGGRPIHD